MNIPRSLVSALSLIVGGCLSIPPHTAAPQLRAQAPVTQEAQSGTAGWPAPDWWQNYHDVVLSLLIERALAQSPNIAAARARFDSASADVRARAAAAGLKIDADAQYARARLSDTGLLPPSALGFNWYSTYDLGLNARYDVDLWGKQAALLNAASADERAAAAERDAATLALASSIAEVYFGWQADSARLQLARDRVAALEHDAAIVSARLRADIARSDELQRAKFALLEARDRVASALTSRQMRVITLAALLGCAPEQLPQLSVQPLPEPPTELPASLSLDLMARRPDLTASRWRVESALANVEAARAGFMPDVSLRALLGLSSLDIGKLLESGSAVPNFSAAIHLPLFDAGRLRAQHAGQQSRLNAAAADYDAALIAAALQINGELENRAAMSGQLRMRNEQLAATEQLRSRAGERLAQGLTDARPEVAATLDWLAAIEARIVTQYARVSADLALIRALGGGYDSGS